MNEDKFFKKLISVERIQSISEEYVLVSSSHTRVIYWEYNCSIQALAEKLKQSGLIIA